MRIKFIAHEEHECHCIGQEWQGELKAVGHTIVNGHRIAANGILKPFVEDITQYDEEGNEILPEPASEEIVLPTMSNTVAEIKAFMDLHGIAYNSSDLKSDLLEKIDWFYRE